MSPQRWCLYLFVLDSFRSFDLRLCCSFSNNCSLTIIKPGVICSVRPLILRMHSMAKEPRGVCKLFFFFPAEPGSARPPSPLHSFQLLRPHLSLRMVQHSITVLAVGYIGVFFRHLYINQADTLNRGLDVHFSGDLLCLWTMNVERLPLTEGLERKMSKWVEYGRLCPRPVKISL